jgi:hypothetical protein
MPFSYHGFGPTAILLMIVCIVASIVYRRLTRKKIANPGLDVSHEKN